jgi:hypothetical protein
VGSWHFRLASLDSRVTCVMTPFDTLSCPRAAYAGCGGGARGSARPCEPVRRIFPLT